MRIAMNDGWLFTSEYGKGFEEAKEIRIPHTCKEIPYNYGNEQDYQMVCGYQKTINIKKEWLNKRIFITFDGAAHLAVIYWNDREIFTHACGYTAFTVELTGDLKEGDNQIRVKLDSRESQNIPPFGFVIDYMTYGGLYREVWLDIKDSCYLADAFVTTENNNVHAQIAIAGEVPENTTLTATIYDSQKREVAQKKTFVSKLQNIQSVFPENGQALSGKMESYQLSLETETVEIWDTQHPVLYTVSFALSGSVQDHRSVRFGFRTIEFRKEGFYLNGNKIKLRGLNRHQSYPYVGYAMPKAMQIMDADILKYELGVNAVRTSHYPQSQHFIDRCDELGLLVFTEIPGWQHIGDLEWQEQAIRNCEEMVVQYRNHPSILLWGVRINESIDNDDFYRKTNEVAHRLDGTRPTSGVRFLEKSSLLEDVYAYNDFSYAGGKKRALKRKNSVTSNREKAYLVSEFNGHMFPTKMFDEETHRLEQAIRHAKVLEAMEKDEEIAGCFGWCMFDYNTHKDFGSGDRICYHGVMDMFRNPKLAAAVYASQREDKPVLIVSSTMEIGEHPAGNLGDVYVFTNADQVRFYKNKILVCEYQANDAGASLKHAPIQMDDLIGTLLEKEESYSHSTAEEIKKCLNAIRRYGQESLPLRYKWKLGKLMLFKGMTLKRGIQLYGKYVGNWGAKSTTYRFEAIKNGKIVGAVERHPVEKIMISAEVDHTILLEADTYDVAAVRITAMDEFGNVLPYYQEAVTLLAEGAIQIIGPDVITLKGGYGGTYIKSTNSGTGSLLLTSKQGQRITIDFSVVRESKDRAKEDVG